jgi:hypothetical protein
LDDVGTGRNRDLHLQFDRERQLETLKPALLQEESGHSGFTPPQVG